MGDLSQIVIFTLERIRLGLPISRVDKVVNSVEITPLPGAPEIITGVINFHGRIIPVASIRARFGLAPRDIGISDNIIIGRTSRRPVGIVADSVSGVFDMPEGALTGAEDILHGIRHIEGAVKLKDGIVLIQDIDAFLSIEEEKLLDKALEKEIPGNP